MKGKWSGFFKYDSPTAKEKLGIEKTNFTINIDTFENNHFKGTVEDDLSSKGTPGTGEIEGMIAGDKISFTKRMPVKTVISLNDDMQTFGMRTYPQKHKPVYYKGILATDKKSIAGTWKMKLGFSVLGFYVTLFNTNGNVANAQ